jgi:hypothetical protein
MTATNLTTWPPWVDFTKLKQQDLFDEPCNVVPSCKEQIFPLIEMSH